MRAQGACAAAPPGRVGWPGAEVAPALTAAAERRKGRGEEAEEERGGKGRMRAHALERGASRCGSAMLIPETISGNHGQSRSAGCSADCSASCLAASKCC